MDRTSRGLLRTVHGGRGQLSRKKMKEGKTGGGKIILVGQAAEKGSENAKEGRDATLDSSEQRS